MSGFTLCSGSYTGAADSMHPAHPPQNQRTARPDNTRSDITRAQEMGRRQGKISEIFSTEVSSNVMDFEHIPDVLTILELQKALRIGRNTAYRLVKSNSIRSIRIGKSIRIPKNYLKEFVEHQNAPTDDNTTTIEETQQ